MSVPRLRRVLLISAIAAAYLAAATSSVSSGTVPSAYRKQDIDAVAKGVEHFRLVRRDPAEVVNVARITTKAPFELRAVPALDRVGDGLERTSAICRRVGCVVGINGDFWKPGTDVPVGGVVSVGRLLRPPSATHEQLTVSADGTLRAGPLRFSASLVPDDLRPLAIGAVNRLPRGDEIVLLTPAVGRSTRAPKGTVELALRSAKPKGLLALHKTTVVRIAKHGSTAGHTPIPADGAVLSGSGRGGRLLRDLLARVRSKTTGTEALLRIESTPKAVESIGGAPVLVRKGKPVTISARTPFVNGRHPRTLIGWRATGEVLLVTVDGRQPRHSDGMTLAEASRLMVNLGAIEALNLDGGGSTTFVKEGKVANRPSDRAVRTLRGRRVVHTAPDAPSTLGHVERPVAIGLMLVPKAKKQPAPAPAALRELEIAEDQQVDAAPTQISDPASDPTGSTADIVYRYGDSRWPIRAVAIAIVTLGVAVAAGLTGYHHGSKPRTRRRQPV